MLGTHLLHPGWLHLSGARRQQTRDQEGDAIALGAELKDSGKLIGDVMVRWVSAEHSCGEIGYVFSPAYSGRGFAAEAAHAGLHLAFDELGLHRVIARIDARNSASARLASRLGMRQEAHLRENEWFKGEWTDEIDFATLAQDWPSQTRRPAWLGAVVIAWQAGWPARCVRSCWREVWDSGRSLG